MVIQLICSWHSHVGIFWSVLCKWGACANVTPETLHILSCSVQGFLDITRIMSCHLQLHLRYQFTVCYKSKYCDTVVVGRNRLETIVQCRIVSNINENLLTCTHQNLDSRFADTVGNSIVRMSSSSRSTRDLNCLAAQHAVCRYYQDLPLIPDPSFRTVPRSTSHRLHLLVYLPELICEIHLSYFLGVLIFNEYDLEV